jgi:hypothetical protein
MASAPEAPPAEEKTTSKVRKVKHPEAAAIEDISVIMEGLKEDSRKRVLRWALDVYWPETIVNTQDGNPNPS